LAVRTRHSSSGVAKLMRARWFRPLKASNVRPVTSDRDATPSVTVFMLRPSCVHVDSARRPAPQPSCWRVHQHRWRSPQRWDKIAISMSAARLDVARYKRLAIRSADTWQGGLFRLPMWIQEHDDDPPYRPTGAFWRSVRTG